MRLTVGPPFFTKWMLPIGLILLTLTGIGPLLAWRRSSPSNLRYQFMWPATLAVVHRRRAVRARLPGLGVGAVLRPVRVRGRDHQPGVHPRRGGAAGGDGDGPDDRDDRARGPGRGAATAATSCTWASC